MKCLAFGIGILALYLATVIAAFLTPGLMDGFSGLVIRFFLGYCGIIAVAQFVSALYAIRHALDELSRKQKVSRKVMLR